MSGNRAPLITVALAAGALAACSPPPETPPVDAPPEPQAAGLRDAIQTPLDRARATEDMLRDGTDRKREGSGI